MQTHDLEIRPWAKNDISLLERLMGDPTMMVYLGGPETPEKIQKRHKRYLKRERSGHDQMFVILAGKERVPAGSVGYWEKEWDSKKVWETGWMVLPEFQGQGVATQATALVISKVRDIGLYRFLIALPSVENTASNSICRKLGFELYGTQQYEYPKDSGNWLVCNDWRFDLSPG